MLFFLSQHSKTANKVRSRVLLLRLSNASEILRVSFHGEYRTCHREESLKDIQFRASLVAQWLRICLLMQGTRVRALVWEDPTCHGAAGPVSHNY